MAVAQTEASSVRKGLSDRMKPKEAQSTQASGQTNYSSRFQNPGAGSNRSRTLDRSQFQNPNVGRRPQSQGYTQQGGQVPGQYQTPGRPQTQQPQTAQPYYPQPQAPPQQTQAPPQTAQSYYPPVQAPAVAGAPIQQPRYQPPQTAQSYYPQQQYRQYPQTARPTWVNGQLQASQQYNPTPYNRRW